jgi:hypothetical protein
VVIPENNLISNSDDPTISDQFDPILDRPRKPLQRSIQRRAAL